MLAVRQLCFTESKTNAAEHDSTFSASFFFFLNKKGHLTSIKKTTFNDNVKE